jgi:hypothetical protein
MSRPKDVFRLVALCALASAVMAVGAGGAQAEVGSHWNVNGSAISATLLPEVGVTLENSAGRLSTEALGAIFEIRCTGTQAEEFVFKVEGGSLGKVRYSGCKIFLGGKEVVPCEPHTGTEKGVILTNLMKDLIVLHEGQPVDRFEPETGEIIVTIQTSAECAVGGKAGIPVIGKFFAKDCKNEGTVEKVTHLVQELGALTELWVLSKTAEHRATLLGSANVALTGAHAGLTWSATPA